MTLSRKNGASPMKRGGPSEWLDALDAFQECCESIETLTGLLEACGREPLEARLVQQVGVLIDREVVKMRKLLKAKWQNQAP